MNFEKIDPAAGHRGAGNCAEWHAANNTYTGDPTQHALAALRMGLKYKTAPHAVAPVVRLLMKPADMLWGSAVLHHGMPPELADRWHRTALTDLWATTDWRELVGADVFADRNSNNSVPRTGTIVPTNSTSRSSLRGGAGL